jgi:cytochrome c-type biogenesis protein CcmH/NrfG
MTLGDLYGRTSRFRNALGAFERASRLAPAEVAPIGNMALSLTELGETGRARALLDSVFAREPQNARARALLSRIDQMDAARAPAAGGHGRGAAEER